jgi:plasmid stabilization system protein ParE
MSFEPGFELHPGAAQDIVEIWEFIAQHSMVAARKVREEILDAVRKSVPFPRSGHRRSDLTSRPLRFHVVRDYLIAYSPERRPLVVIAVLHGRRNPRSITSILETRQ